MGPTQWVLPNESYRVAQEVGNEAQAEHTHGGIQDGHNQCQLDREMIVAVLQP